MTGESHASISGTQGIAFIISLKLGGATTFLCDPAGTGLRQP
jgi:hypothetical protein